MTRIVAYFDAELAKRDQAIKQAEERLGRSGRGTN